MNCSKIMEMVYEDDNISLFDQLQISLHSFFCCACSQEIDKYQAARAVLRKDFFPNAPEYLENSIMTKIANGHEEDPLAAKLPAYTIPGGLSTRGWVIAGLIVMISLVTAFFGFDFKNLTNEFGMSFILPVGITIGIVLTVYCALFIGSHLKELTERFGL